MKNKIIKLSVITTLVLSTLNATSYENEHISFNLDVGMKTQTEPVDEKLNSSAYIKTNMELRMKNNFVVEFSLDGMQKIGNKYNVQNEAKNNQNFLSLTEANVKHKYRSTIITLGRTKLYTPLLFSDVSSPIKNSFDLLSIANNGTEDFLFYGAYVNAFNSVNDLTFKTQDDGLFVTGIKYFQNKYHNSEMWTYYQPKEFLSVYLETHLRPFKHIKVNLQGIYTYADDNGVRGSLNTSLNGNNKDVIAYGAEVIYAVSNHTDLIIALSNVEDGGMNNGPLNISGSSSPLYTNTKTLKNNYEVVPGTFSSSLTVNYSINKENTIGSKVAIYSNEYADTDIYVGEIYWNLENKKINIDAVAGYSKIDSNTKDKDQNYISLEFNYKF